jgi:hypothetical protein
MLKQVYARFAFGVSDKSNRGMVIGIDQELASIIAF